MIEKPLRLVSYVRCSTDKQDDSLQTQDTLIAEECERKGYLFVRSYRDEAVSASVPIEKRPGGRELFQDVKKKNRGFDAIIVIRLDRLFRDPEDELGGLGYLTKHSCSVISIKDPIDRSTPVGELLHGIMMHVRKFERRQTGQRIREHNIALALRGEWPAGKPAMGFSYDNQSKKLLISDRASDVVTVFEEFVHSGGNATKTAQRLNAAGIPTRDGNPWRNDAVLDTVKSAVYRRNIKYDSRLIYAPDVIPEIIPPDLLAVVDGIIAKRAIRVNGSRSKSGKYAYSNILTCSQCGSRMKAHSHGNGVYSHKSYLGWVCRTKSESGGCDSRKVSNNYLDTLVAKAFFTIISKASSDDMIEESKKVRKAEDRNQKRIRQIESMKDRLKELYLNSRIDMQEYVQRLDGYDAEIAALKTEQSRPSASPEYLFECLKRAEATWLQLDHDSKREILTILEVEIVVNTGERPLWIELFTSVLPESIKVSLEHTNR